MPRCEAAHRFITCKTLGDQARPRGPFRRQRRRAGSGVLHGRARWVYTAVRLSPDALPRRTPARTAGKDRVDALPLRACPRGSRPRPAPRASPAALPGVPPGAPRHDALRAASPNQAPAGCSVKRADDRLAGPSLTRKESAIGRHAGPVIRSRSATGASQRQCASIRLHVDVVGRHRQRSRPDQVVLPMASAAPVRFLSLALAARSNLYGGDVPVSSAHMARRPSWTAGRLRRDRSGSCAGGRSEPARGTPDRDTAATIAASSRAREEGWR